MAVRCPIYRNNLKSCCLINYLISIGFGDWGPNVRSPPNRSPNDAKDIDAKTTYRWDLAILTSLFMTPPYQIVESKRGTR
jgi:hypothetical protein